MNLIHRNIDFEKDRDYILGRHSVATQLYEYAEAKARRNGAKVIRAGTGLCNSASIQLHKKLGFAPYRYEFEKLLMKAK